MESIQRQSLHGMWSSRLVFILAASGAAIGLGNIWKFPYMAGMGGGAAFILIYLAAVLTIGLPILLSEVMLGRRGRRNPVDTMQNLAIEAGSTPLWRYLGWIGALTILLMFSFYSVVAGWTIAYTAMGFDGTFSQASARHIGEIFAAFVADPLMLLVWHTAFMLLVMGTVILGIRKGLERVSYVIMPLMFALIILLIGYGAAEGDMLTAAEFLFRPDFSQIDSSTIISAMGLAFFTLAVGAGALLVYGAYLPKSVPIGSSLLVIAGLDTLIALLAGLAIFPIVFQHGLSPAEGPGLVFVTLPIAFGVMPAGDFFAGVFFLLLLFAAWTSAISFAEPLTMLLMERGKISRTKAAIIVGFCVWFLGIGTLLSFNLWSEFKFFGHWNFFAAVDGLALNVLLPLGGLGFAIFSGWIMKREDSYQELALRWDFMYQVWRFLVRFVTPLMILVVFINALI